MDKILHCFIPSYLLNQLPVKLRYLYFFSTKKDTIICVNNVIPITNLSAKLDVHFIHSKAREIQIYFQSCMANFKIKSKLLCAKLSSGLKYIKVRTALSLFICFYGSLGSRSERPRALQLVIKMLIRCCLKWDGRSTF